MDLEKLKAEGKAIISCQDHYWQTRIINAILQCERCFSFGVCFNSGPGVFMLDELVTASKSHCWKTKIGWVECGDCGMRGKAMNDFPVYYNKISKSYNQVKTIKYIPFEPLSCAEVIMKQVME